ncbi:MAG: histidine kinase [Dorea sp.]|nr:histidine kinase [Dorea sp.]
MKTMHIFYEAALNIALLVLMANLMLKFGVIRDMILQEKRSFKSQALLSALFGGLVILSTCTAINTGSYNINTRAIGAMAAGLLGGPVVGLYASLIGAVYAYIFCSPQVFAMAAAFSTMMFGLLGGGFYPYFQRGKWRYQDLFLLTCFAEICDMICLLRFAVPVQMAMNTVLEISVPMILINSVGILIFISSFDTIFVFQDIESSRQLQRASKLAKKCLPLLPEGISHKENMQRLAEIMLEEIDWAGVMITDRTQIIVSSQKEAAEEVDFGTEVPDVGQRAMSSGDVEVMYKVPLASPMYELMKDYSLVAAPFVIREQAIGCLIVWVKKKWVLKQSELKILQHLVTLSSYQIALAELEQQRLMRERAEFKALQFQVNPHFLFNALNTISYVCREEPERARELLLTLANYFRYNLNYDAYIVPLVEELKHVQDYLEIEKARFEEKLLVTFEVPDVMDIDIPTLILQPIVENAVRYGINQEGKRVVRIQIEEEPEGCMVCVSDEGRGISEDILNKLKNDEPIGNSIGLSNVHKRMKNMYGEENGLHFRSTVKGTCVEMHFLKSASKEEKDENRNN